MSKVGNDFAISTYPTVSQVNTRTIEGNAGLNVRCVNTFTDTVVTSNYEYHHSTNARTTVTIGTGSSVDVLSYESGTYYGKSKDTHHPDTSNYFSTELRRNDLLLFASNGFPIRGQATDFVGVFNETVDVIQAGMRALDCQYNLG